MEGDEEAFMESALRLWRRFFNREESGRFGRTCPGCPRACWRTDPDTNTTYLENDLDSLAEILEGRTAEEIVRFYDRSRRRGVDPLAAARRLGNAPRDQEGGLQNEAPSPPTGFQPGHYLDTGEYSVNSLERATDRELLAMGKWCLPICGRWTEPGEELLGELRPFCGEWIDPDGGSRKLIGLGSNIIKNIKELTESKSIAS